jgi:6,7-dimethyl-8-ribityllumazine synthase
MSDRYETPRWDDEPEELLASEESATEMPDATERESDLDASSENVLDGWPAVDPLDVDDASAPAEEPDVQDESASDEASGQDDSASDEPSASGPDAEPAPVALSDHVSTSSEHAPGELTVPPGYAVLEGEARGESRRVGIVVSRFNGDVTTALLESALAELDARGVTPDSVTVMPVPGAFELPLAAMALAKTRRFSCIVALGCVIRGDTPHFDYVSSEAASGLQLAAIETGVPVAFGLLTLDRADQAESRSTKGAEAVRTGLEMADLFANLRAAAAR